MTSIFGIIVSPGRSTAAIPQVIRLTLRKDSVEQHLREKFQVLLEAARRLRPGLQIEIRFIDQGQKRWSKIRALRADAMGSTYDHSISCNKN